MVRKVMSTNVVSCSMLANFHQPRQRVMFASSAAKT